MFTAAVFLNVEQAFDTTWQYKLPKLKFSVSLIKLISSFLSLRKFRVSVEGEMTAPRDIQPGVPQGSALPPPPTLYNIYFNDMPQTPGVYLGLFAEDTCIYATDRKEVYVLRKLQRGLSAVETQCDLRNIKISEEETETIYFSHRFRSPDAHLALTGRNILFVNVKCLGVITWKLHAMLRLSEHLLESTPYSEVSV
jgi:hypothetical protein